MLVLALLFGLAIVLLANFKTLFSIGLPLRVMGLTVSLILVLSTLIGCGTLSTGGGTGSGGSTGTGGGGSTIAATSVSNMTVNPSSVAAGSSASATVTLNAPAPAGGAPVTLTSSNAAAASVPTSVTVAAGQTSVGFAVATGNVSSDTSVLITASYNNTVASIRVSVKAPVPTSTPISISITPSSASLLAGASQQFTATVTGSTNTSVSWTATGGNITNTGLFTAPNVSASTIVTVYATSQADPSVASTAQVTVSPATTPPPPGGGSGAYSGTGPIASWRAYLYLDTDNRYHQAIEIYNAQGAYPVIGYSYVGPGCTNLPGDTFNDFWQPIGNGLWWFINQPNLVYVTWVWYDNATNKQILQQTPCIDYSGAPKYN